jgi:hypothetical protein
LFYETKGWVLLLALVSHPGMATVGFPDIGLPDFLIREPSRNTRTEQELFLLRSRIWCVSRLIHSLWRWGQFCASAGDGFFAPAQLLFLFLDFTGQ